MNAIRPGLPPLPERMRDVPIDERGFPVPWFVGWVDGKPDHRLADTSKIPLAVRGELCWMCGKKMGAYKTFCIGPMCCITRTISEPPSHIECLHFAVQACPWLSRPHAKRREAGMPEERVDPAGVGIKRNPGVQCLWTTKAFRVYFNRSPDGLHGNEGVLFKLGDPVALEWWAEGRRATRDEVDESVRTGLPLLEEAARGDDEYNEPRRRTASLLPFSRLSKPAVVELAERIGAFNGMLDQVLPRTP